ncbi:MAG: nitrate ABC transporter ATP-binding protein [Alteromonadaceae bacterium]|uniref:ABC transporter ATP-binding protein n=2 Tax=Hydrocarboniclastica marina TaxID=2259620 RepID=A0A4P7XLJ7_9ALTE|nr:nitrate ABC transporter ATP-binding protein [Alteromonadaceae bacterium]QCF27424.1 ABC transporter ATP-binding protein [Hydrocarboniclastica marina]
MPALAVEQMTTSNPQKRPDKPLVEFRNVSLAYDETGNAIEDITLNIRRGEFIAFVGPSGCGKSTFMKLCTGLRQPTSGGIVVNGKEVTGPLSITGMAFQNSNLLPWRSVLKNVMLPLEIVEPHRSRLRKHYQEYEDKARRLLAIVGLEGYEHSAPYELSGGMQQRASICRALIHEPELLMLDEPFAALDAFTREELWCMLRDLWQEQQFTVVLVTHDLREAAFLADTIYVMSKRPGRVLEARSVDIPRPRALESTYEKPLADLVLSLRTKIGAIRE